MPRRYVLSLAVLLALTAAPLAQPRRETRPTWERYASFGDYFRTVEALAFDRRPLRSSADTLYAVVNYQVIRIAPGGLPSDPLFNWPGEYLAITADGEILTGGHWDLSRSADGGRTWDRDVVDGTVYGLLASTHPSGVSAVFVSTFGTATNSRSLVGGEAGTWEVLGAVPGYPLARFHAYGELSPSPAVPGGRLLAATGGILYSDDRGRTWTASNTMPQFPSAPQLLGVEHLAAAPDSRHPYGGVAYAAARNYAADGRWAVYASEDGGRTWEARHTFAPGEFGRSFESTMLSLAAAPNGAVFVGVRDSPWTYGADGRMGTVLRSSDGGRTWEEFSSGLDGDAVTALALGRDGRLYAGATNLRIYGSADVWRTTSTVAFPPRDERGAIAAGSPAGPPAPLSPVLLVAPSPVRTAAEVLLSVAEDGTRRVALFDALGREVAILHVGDLAAGTHAFQLDATLVPPGIYIVRAMGDGLALSSRITVVR